MDCSIYVAKTKALISCAVTVQLISVFVFAYAKKRFSHDPAHVIKVFQFVKKFSPHLSKFRVINSLTDTLVLLFFYGRVHSYSNLNFYGTLNQTNGIKSIYMQTTYTISGFMDFSPCRTRLSNPIKCLYIYIDNEANPHPIAYYNKFHGDMYILFNKTASE